MANISTITNLIINRLSQSKYEQLCAAGQLDPYQLYMTENSQLDAKNSQIKNVASPLLGTDAANKDYVDNCISNIDIPADLSSFSNSPNYVKQNEIDLSYSNQTLWLSSKSYVTSVDCADFIKDGMLSNVELCDNQLIFEFNTDSGTTPISVALSNFIDETQYWKKSETSSASEISAAIDSVISSSNKIFIKDPSVQEYANGKQSDLSVIKLTNEEYAQILQTSADPNVLYVISNDYKNAYGQQLKNLAQGTDLSDAVNVEQLSIAIAYKADVSSLSDYTLSSDISNILSLKADISSIPLSTSQLINDSDFISAHQSLSDYYEKSETSSATEISVEVNMLSDAISQKSKVTFVVWED